MNLDKTPSIPVPGQRWASNLEPELGLGIIQSIENQFVVVSFPACEETRRYSREASPLYRVRFQPGATVRNMEGADDIVTTVSDFDGLLTYHGENIILPEQDLHPGMTDRSPGERLLQGQVTDNALFELRLNAIKMMFQWRKSPVRGLFGGKIDLIPHQLYVAHEVSNRQLPRVLLADEVGLGKTIEACLILNRMLICGQIKRVLILLPNPLVNQWFVELLRRFNLLFSIFDEERCCAIESGQAGFNPFEDDQLLITDIDWLADSPKRIEQAVKAPWDMLIVDEAHHLKWNPVKPSNKYQLVQALGQRAETLLLLTATPQQLGQESHFARLRLLDPARFSSYSAFKEETDQHKAVAHLCKKLIDNEELNIEELQQFPCSESLLTEAKHELAKGKKLAKQTSDRLIHDLADRHGTGRVLFRNTRKTIGGFPKRLAKLEALPIAISSTKKDAGQAEFQFDIGSSETEPSHNFNNDERIEWLMNLLNGHLSEKILLICRTKAKVTEIESALKKRSNLKIGVFHEELTLLQRDRNAAWFAQKDGARLLICSEIGSEGRNFQFCSHLVFFDIPLNPELVEQRIGRLDRIGQKNNIQLHILFTKSSNQEQLSNWLHHGLKAFEESMLGGETLLKEFVDRLHNCFRGNTAKLPQLIKETDKRRKALCVKLQEGTDRLLEINSHSSETSAKLIREIHQIENSAELEKFALQLFDFMGLGVDDIGPRTYRITHAGRLPVTLPGNRDGTAALTFDRARAVSRDDLIYVSMDHPVIHACVEQLLGLDVGTAVFAHWNSDSTPTLLMESVFVLECLAPQRLNADRFLPPTPIRVVINHRGKPELGQDGRFILLPQRLQNGPAHLIPDFPEIWELIQPMAQASESLAAKQANELKQVATANMDEKLTTEIQRLNSLAKLNTTVRPEELTLLKKEQSKLANCLSQARFRLDSIRLVWKGGMERLKQ
ncbi:MAG: RNA polymerase-associated protein RapA [Verrucomicrobiota bacterium]|nr:RNA polymerase-associated protein RapA [Verrucomicrobiota bacterium]